MSVVTRIARVLQQMHLLPEGGALDYSKPNVTTSKAGASAPPRDDSLALDWERRFTRLAEAAEHDLDRHKRGAEALPPKQAKAGSARETQRRRVLTAYVDQTPQYVAFIEDMTTEGVRKMRARANRDPDTGRRLPSIVGPEGA